MHRKQTNSLFDHLVGADKQGWWDFEAKRLGGLEIYGQLELDRLFYRKLARSRATQNLGNVTGGAPIHVRKARSVGEQSAVSGEYSGFPDRRKAMAGRQFDQLVSMEIKKGEAIVARPFAP
jgi:hypothetical protein